MYYVVVNFVVLSCYNAMARPEVVNGGTVSNMEGSWQYIE